LGLTHEEARYSCFDSLVKTGRIELEKPETQPNTDEMAQTVADLVAAKLQPQPVDLNALVARLVKELVPALVNEIKSTSSHLPLGAQTPAQPMPLPSYRLASEEPELSPAKELEERPQSPVLLPSASCLFIDRPAEALSLSLSDIYGEFQPDDMEFDEFDSSFQPISHTPPLRCSSRSVGTNALRHITPTDSNRYSSSPVNVEKSLADTALGHLRQMLRDENGDWKSEAQMHGILAVLRHQSDVAIFTATGSGKTASLVIAALHNPSRAVIAVLPLKSLKQDYERKLTAMGIPYQTWSTVGQEDAALNSSHNLILVTIDQVRKPAFKTAVVNLHEIMPVDRIFVDECHYGITADDFRNSCRFVSELRIVPAQLVLLSGTVPPAAVARLREAYGLLPTATILRTTTVRPEIQYVLDPPQGEHRMSSRIKELKLAYDRQFAARDRGLIFVTMHDHAKSYSKELGVKRYVGGDKMTNSERAASYEAWISGKSKWMVCTNAFAAGNDYGHVRAIIFSGTPFEFVDTIQGMGRAGRDGLHAVVHVVPNPPRNVLPSSAPNSVYKGYREMHRMLYPDAALPKPCLRAQITQFTDGQPTSCTSAPSVVRCSHCSPINPDGFPTIYPTRYDYSNPVITPRADLVTTKRTADDTDQPDTYEAATACAKRQRLERHGASIRYLNRLKEALDHQLGTCTLCRVCRRPATEGHSIFRCPTLQISGLLDNFKAFRKLNYNKNFEHHRNLCWRCHVPQLSADLHEQNLPGQPPTCQHSDVLGPFFVGLWIRKDLRARAEKESGVGWAEPTSYKKWLLCKPEKSENQTNLVALFMWWWDLEKSSSL
jgi:hypothetical protein